MYAVTSTGGEELDDILHGLISDEGFLERVRYGVGFHGEDTQDAVLRRLWKCEELEIEEAPYGEPIFSLEDLSIVPNLKSLTVEIDTWDDSRITDFTPIAKLSRLEELTINYDLEEEMPQLKYLSLYGSPAEDLAVLENLPELVELSLAGNENAEHIEAVGRLTGLERLGYHDSKQ